MITKLYFVRHAESPYVEGEDRTRGLSERGKSDALKVSKILKDKLIDLFVSSPYERAIQTIKPTAGNQDIILIEDLREREIGTLAGFEFMEAKLKVFQDFNFTFPDGESSNIAQQRAVSAIWDIINSNKGKKILIGTHGDIMTLIFNYFDNTLEFDFWKTTTMPDIYLLEFEGQSLLRMTREW